MGAALHPSRAETLPSSSALAAIGALGYIPPSELDKVASSLNTGARAASVAPIGAELDYSLSKPSSLFLAPPSSAIHSYTFAAYNANNPMEVS